MESTAVFIVLNLAGTVALLLWGTHMVQTGVQRSFGPRLRSVLSSALRRRLAAFLAGIGVTALMQSSTATGLMVAGFAAGGVVDLVPGLAVMLGANVGTTLIVQLFSFDVAVFSPVLILIGLILFRRGGAALAHDLGRVFIGLGLMLLALHQLLVIVSPIEDGGTLARVIATVSVAPLIYVLVAAGLTWLAHSSVAVVLLVMSLAARGIVPPEAAFALVLGANLGTAVNPVLEARTGDDPGNRRLPLGNLANRVFGVVVALALVTPLTRLMTAIDPNPARAVADFHTLFNLALALVFLPLLTPYAALLKRVLPARGDPADPSRPLYLDARGRTVPAIALGAAAREALRLVDVLEIMLRGARDGLEKGDRLKIEEAKRLDDVLDQLNTAIKGYVTALPESDLSAADRRRLNEILTFATNMEHAGDTIDRNLLPLAAKRLKRGLAFSEEGIGELAVMFDRVLANLRTAAALFMTDDPRAARLLAAEKEAFRDIEAAATQSHFDRLRAGRSDTAETSALHLDVIRDLKRINSHLVAGAAYPVLERGGELLPTRIAPSGV